MIQPEDKAEPGAFETARLCLRPVREEDAPILLRLWSQPDVRRYLHGGRGVSATTVLAEITDSTRRFAAAGYGLWAAFAREDGTLVGTGGFRRLQQPPRIELSYAVDEGRRGQGYATEFVGELVRRAFELHGIKALEAAADAGNAASLRLLVRMGFLQQTRLWEQGRDLIVMSQTARDWARRTGGGSV